MYNWNSGMSVRQHTYEEKPGNDANRLTQESISELAHRRLGAFRLISTMNYMSSICRKADTTNKVICNRVDN